MFSIDFKKARELVKRAQELDELLQTIPEQTNELEKAVTLCARGLRLAQARLALERFSVEELKKTGNGIRVSLLSQAGYDTLAKVDAASDQELSQIQGIGEGQIRTIRSVIDEFTGQLATQEVLLLTEEKAGDTDTGRTGDKEIRRRLLLTALARYRLAEQICRDAGGAIDDTHHLLTDTLPHVRLTGRFRWIFSGSDTKEETRQALQILQNFFESNAYTRLERFIALFTQAVSLDETAALEDFRRETAAFYATLERLTDTDNSQRRYGSIPEALAAEISEQELNLQAFRGDLRGYQRFGAQYILHQERVLLGDEMGLGKTVEAIAVMAHLYERQRGEAPSLRSAAGCGEAPSLRSAAGCRFLIVAPASVLINWCREIAKFTQIPAHLLHGDGMETGFTLWRENGGAAVVSYEGMRRIVDRIDEHIRLDLLIIDEAHYIKNPDAKRTMRIRRLEDEADRILLMSGTPMENRVEELCELIRILRPEITREILTVSGLRNIAAFRELLAPVYLRRQASQVLSELPPLIEREEWCAPTPEDIAACLPQLEDRNFQGLRRIGFLQEDMKTSSKGQRLLELCEQARDEGKKVMICSYFRETLRHARELTAQMCVGEITGSTPALARQEIIDDFSAAPEGSVLICQVLAGGIGLNIQAASVVILCEPQIKPSLEHQAIGRVHRMGQLENVLVCRLICSDSVDEAILRRLQEKQEQFDLYAEESEMARAEEQLITKEWIRDTIEQERQKYLPATVCSHSSPTTSTTATITGSTKVM